MSLTITYSNSPTPLNSFLRYSPFSVDRTVPRTLWPLHNRVEHKCEAMRERRERGVSGGRRKSRWKRLGSYPFGLREGRTYR